MTGICIEDHAAFPFHKQNVRVVIGLTAFAANVFFCGFELSKEPTIVGLACALLALGGFIGAVKRLAS